jgi:Flp pilus assembly protein TadG
MRVRRFSLARLRDDEQGAVLAIVAITLIALLGMLVLTFDLGRGVALKRNMVNAADAGALAAARECGLAHGEPSATAAAGELVADNNDAATVTGFEINPDPAVCSGAGNPDPDGKNTVTVTVTVPQEYFFAQIFGFDEGSVVASATAEWTSGVANPVPLKLNVADVEGCTSGTDCYFEFAKDQTGSQRGWLDFPQGWPTDNNDPRRCTSQAGGANELGEYIEQMGLEGSVALQAVLRDPAPTYVCAAGGVPNRLIGQIVDWLNATADLTPSPIVDFPMVACDGVAPPCYPWFTGGGERGAYPVVDFAGLSVVQAWSGHAAQNNPNCEFERNASDVFCIQLKVADPGAPRLHNAVVVRLVG